MDSAWILKDSHIFLEHKGDSFFFLFIYLRMLDGQYVKSL